MSNCKNCGKPVESVQGRRQREFCDNKQYCRNQWHNKNKAKKDVVKIPAESLNEGKLYSWVNGKLIEMAEKQFVQESEAICKAAEELKNGTATTKGIIPQITTTTTEPKENTMAFFNKYGVMTKDELKSEK